MTEDNRIPEIRHLINRRKLMSQDRMERALIDRLLAILDNPPPAPRVFLPGDIAPKGVATMIPPSPDEDRAQPYVMHEAPWNYTVTRPVVELPLPSTEEVQAAVDRACAEREES